MIYGYKDPQTPQKPSSSCPLHWGLPAVVFHYVLNVCDSRSEWKVQIYRWSARLLSSDLPLPEKATKYALLVHERQISVEVDRSRRGSHSKQCRS